MIDVISLLKKYSITPNRSAGQNFLLDEDALAEIVAAASLQPTDNVLEVGPGVGVLTKELVLRAKKVVAVELDRTLAYVMKQEFRGVENLDLVNQDILTVKAAEIAAWFQGEPFKVVANIPYNITSRLIRKLLTMSSSAKASEDKPVQLTSLVLLVQKEVAQRIVAKPGKMSRLAVSAQFFADPEIIAYVPSASFYPAPEVDSAIIRLTSQPGKFAVANEKEFFRLVRIGFSAKRKQLQNNLVNGYLMPKTQALAWLQRAGLKPTVRPQELSVGDWVRLSMIPQPSASR